ncbi:Trm112 family protein [Hydrogenivirga sp.]
MLDEKLLGVLACPVCKGELSYDREKDVLICNSCGVYYEVKEGIPVLLPDSGRPLSEGSS